MSSTSDPAIENELTPIAADLTDEPIQVTVEARAHGWRIDHYLARLFPNYSRGIFQRAIEAEAVLLNGLPVKPSRRVRVNDRLDVSLLEQPDDTLEPEDIPLSIIYEDESLAVINKPADMVTHPSKGNFKGTLAAAVQFHFNQLSDVAGQMRPGIVHRLDRDTTGVILIAKSNQTHHRLSGQFERREVQKEYRAIVRGELDRQSDRIETHLRVHPKVREKMLACGPEDGARHAVTDYEVLERFRGYTYVRLLPHTGRTHQLRVHMLHIGHPIVTDHLYAGQKELRLSDLLPPDALATDAPATDITLISRQALHAYRLEVRHPVTDRSLVFQADLPEDIARTLEALRRHRTIQSERRSS
jgi:23S rRNA pseudouridine1911/1915/1917 synthase